MSSVFFFFFTKYLWIPEKKILSNIHQNLHMRAIFVSHISTLHSADPFTATRTRRTLEPRVKDYASDHAAEDRPHSHLSCKSKRLQFFSMNRIYITISFLFKVVWKWSCSSPLSWFRSSRNIFFFTRTRRGERNKWTRNNETMRWPLFLTPIGRRGTRGREVTAWLWMTSSMRHPGVHVS